MKHALTALSVILMSTSSFFAQATTQQDIDLALAPIKNSTDLQVVLSDKSSFDVLNDELSTFVNSIQFKNTTLDTPSYVQFDQDILKSNLTATEIYHILSLFGLQSTIKDYYGAAVVTTTDRLLIPEQRLTFCNATYPIDLIVKVNKHNLADFKYKQQGVECDGNVLLTENTTITYQLKHKYKTPKGLRLIGAGFTNPFESHISNVTVSEDGQSISLQNNIENLGVSKYQFMLTSDVNDLVLLSPDPEVVNRPGPL